ncbi:hypothetical protein [Amycolatopsis pittospori]|nr:hypothetical protein [Amycolatopsis pittospori]
MMRKRLAEVVMTLSLATAFVVADPAHGAAAIRDIGRNRRRCGRSRR